MITTSKTRVLVLGAFAVACLGVVSARTAGIAAGLLVQNPSGQVSGVVVDAVTGKPVADARVTLSLVGRRDPGMGVSLPDPERSRPQQVFTASNGAFQLRAVAAGQYSLAARKPGYLTAYFGQQQADEALQWFHTRTDENVTGVTLRLWPGAVIAGQVHTVSGAPLSGKWVQLFDLKPQNGLPHIGMASLSSQATDDRGEYRISGVPPGRYLVRVSDGESLWIMDILGHAPGRLEPPCVCVFYPHASSALGADVITVTGGEERTHVDVDVPDSGALPGYQVSGHISLTFEPFGRQAHLVLADHTADVPAYMDVATAAIQSDGSFVFPYVPPGHYLIRGVLSPVPLAAFNVPPDPSDPVRRPVWPVEQPYTAPTAWFSEPVTVTDKPLTELAIQARPGSRVLGKITLSPELAGLDLSGVSITARALDGWSLEGVPNGRVERDGTFSSAALPPGKFLVLPDARDNYWFADSAVLVNKEVIATGFDVGTTEMSGLVVTLTRLGTRVAGTVVDTSGTVRPDAHVLYFRKDGNWLAGDPGLPGGEVGNVRTDRFGAYELTLHAGEYFIVAVAGDIPEAWQDPVFLQSVIPFAAKVSLARGAAITQGLTVRVLRKK